MFPVFIHNKCVFATQSDLGEAELFWAPLKKLKTTLNNHLNTIFGGLINQSICFYGNSSVT